MDELKTQLRETLATVFAFYLKCHNYHWNVDGPLFYTYHNMFRDISDDVYSSVDKFAEHLRTFGTYAPGGLSRFAELSKVDDATTSHPSAKEMVNQLLADSEIVLTSLNACMAAAEKQNAQGLMNFLGERIEQHQKWAWFLRASSKGE
mgnify:CR=1 FL=1